VAQFDMRGQRVTNQYNAGRDMNFGAVQTPVDLIAELEKLSGQVTLRHRKPAFSVKRQPPMLSTR
jgi:hypothetical protein